MSELATHRQHRLEFSPRAKLIGALASHAALGVLGNAIPAVFSVHAVVTMGACIAIGFLSADITKMIAAAMYLGGAEVLWRASGAPVPWETAKLVGIGLFILVWVRFLPMPRHIGLAGLLFISLIPAVLISALTSGASFAFEQTSFNLGGLVLLGLAWTTCARLLATPESLRLVLWAHITSTVAMMTLALVRTFSNLDSISWVNDSNFQTSAGFGPNQLSTVLSFSVVLCVLMLWYTRPVPFERVVLVVMLCILTFQIFLTFSRTGIYAAGLALVAAVVPTCTSPKRLVTTLASAIGLVGVVVLLVFPQVDALSNGTAQERFLDTNTTHRSDIAASQYRLFEENLPFGVGVGRTKRLQFEMTGQGYEAHTEYTRLLAEHGILGIVAMVIIAAMAARTVFLGRIGKNTSWSAALIVWSIASMSTTATRVADIGLAFGLAMLGISAANRSTETTEPALEERFVAHQT